MDAWKIDPNFVPVEAEQRESLFRSLPAGDDVSWLQTLEAYRLLGLVNEDLVEMMSCQLRWYAIYRQRPIYNATKGIFDRIVAVLVLTLLSPLFVLAAVAIKATSAGPVFYSQSRIGLYCRPFRIYKFRTMRVGAKRSILFSQNEMQGGFFKIRNDPRVTFVGRFLRRWSIDELPQLLNVVLGDMSLVGPRPLPPEDTGTVKEEHYLRFAAKPGLTGYWQAIARDSRDGAYKVKLDAEYAVRRSWSFDLWLIWRTVITIVKGIGAW